MSEWLYLFSSNVRRQYEQDVIDLLAYPKFARFRFRYEEKYVDPTIRDRWRSDSLAQETRVVVNFSIQEPNRYHNAAFVPVRVGMVQKSGVEGSIYYIDFSLEEYIELAPCPESPKKDSDKDLRRLVVRAYSDHIRDEVLPNRTPDTLIEHPLSAALGVWPAEATQPTEAPLLSWETRMSDEPSVWEGLVTTLYGTLSFRGDVFVRFVSLSLQGGKEIEIERGVFPLTGGTTYELELSHFRPTELPSGTSYTISTDRDLIKPIGREHIAIESRYDKITIPLHASRVDAIRDTTIVVEPREGSSGAKITLLARIERDVGRTVAAASGTAFALLLIALPALLPDSVSTELKTVLAGSGILIGAFLAAFGLKTA